MNDIIIYVPTKTAQKDSLWKVSPMSIMTMLDYADKNPEDIKSTIITLLKNIIRCGFATEAEARAHCDKLNKKLTKCTTI